MESHFFPTFLNGLEDVENYRLGGYHPISISDTFDNGRYRILHKLGYGGSSTVWLARDQYEGRDRGRLVSLKALRSAVSSNIPGEVPEIAIAEKLKTSFPSSVEFHIVDHHFFVQGPNGSHLFLIFPLAGPSILAMYDPWRGGNRRLRADLGKKVANQVAMIIYRLHCAGIVHGDLTTSNILFRLSSHVIQWSDSEVYAHFGEPKTAMVVARDGSPPEPHAPPAVVKPIENRKIWDASLLQESIIISDFGQSYLIASPPPSYKPATMLNYESPEARFESRAGIEADVWALGCTIFEIRTGFPLFDTFILTGSYVLMQTVELLGRLPDPWWAAYKERAFWFKEDGEPKSKEDQEREGFKVAACRTSIRKRLYMINVLDKPSLKDDGLMMEKHGVGFSEEEVEMLEDLLQKMLKYSPEQRICMEDVIKHPWFMC